MTSQTSGRFKYLIALGAVAGGLVSAAETNAPAARIRFDGDSTLHRFGGEVELRDVAWVEHPGRAPDIQGRIKVLDMNTGHRGRDQNMYAMFDAEHFPEIIGEINAEDWSRAGSADSIPVRLIIRNQTNTLNAVVQKKSDAAASRPVALDFDVSLNAFGLKAPSVMGLIKVKDTVRVHVEVNPERMPRAASVKEGVL